MRTIPVELAKRYVEAAKLTDTDRELILQYARNYVEYTRDYLAGAAG